MCPVGIQVSELKLAIDPPKPGCGDSTKPAGYKPLALEDSSPDSSPKSTKEMDDDDPLSYLTVLFGHVTVKDPGGFEDTEDFEASDEESECDPREPSSRGYYDVKYCFSASNRLYYFDGGQNVYSDDGALVYDGILGALTESLHAPNFHIEGVPYWFNRGGLVSQDADGTFHPVLTTLVEPDITETVSHLTQYLDESSRLLDDGGLFQSNLDFASYYNPQVPTIVTTFDGNYDPTECTAAVLPQNVNSNLAPTFHRDATMVMFSPTSSTSKSPIVPSEDPESSEELSLFSTTEPSQLKSPAIISAWQQDTRQAQKAAARTRPVTKPNKGYPWRCPTCSKTFRRPGSLEDHLNVHSGEKPHKCPFERCNTGFAAKSNMKRHFFTHQVGPLEAYQPGMTYEADPTMSKKPSRGAATTYNSKAHHNGRFRITLQEPL